MKAKLISENIDFKRGINSKKALNVGYARWPYFAEVVDIIEKAGFKKSESTDYGDFYNNYSENINVANFRRGNKKIKNAFTEFGDDIIELYYVEPASDKLRIYVETEETGHLGKDYSISALMNAKGDWKENFKELIR